MAGMRGYYGLIQYCPDPSRAEAANVGVILYCPDLPFIGARTSAGNDRIRRFFGQDREFDLGRLNAAKQAIETRLKATGADFRSVEDLNKFIATRANELQVTPLRSVKVQEPEAELDAMFKELVGGRSSKEPRQPTSPVLDEYFHRPSLAGRIQFNPPPVEVPLLGRQLRASYAYRNGVLNLVKPHRFILPDSSRMVAERLAIEGDLLQSPSIDGQRRKLIVVSDFSSELDSKVIGSVRDVLERYHTKVVLPAEIPAFVAEVEREAHPLSA